MNARIWFTIAVMIAAHLAVDFLLPWAMEQYGPQTPYVWPWLGVCVAQVNLIALWAVFAPGGVAWRLPWAAFFTAGMWSVLVLGNRWTNPSFQRGDAVLLGAMLLIGVVLAQVPLWISRNYLRFRLYAPRTTSPVTQTERQFNLQQLMVGMGLLSVILGVARWIMPPGSFANSHWDFELVAIMSIVAIVNLVLTLPATWFVFAPRMNRAIIAMLALIPYSIVITTLEVSVASGVVGNNTSQNWLGLYLFNAGQLVTVVVTLGSLRWQGFRLITEADWQHEQQQVALPAEMVDM